MSPRTGDKRVEPDKDPGTYPRTNGLRKPAPGPEYPDNVTCDVCGAVVVLCGEEGEWRYLDQEEYICETCQKDIDNMAEKQRERLNRASRNEKS